jgi:hypothetical protein
MMMLEIVHKEEVLQAHDHRRAPGGGAGRELAALDLHADGLDPGQNLLPQVGRDLLMTAVLMHEALDDFFEAELAEARAALF